MTIKAVPLDIHEGHVERHHIRKPGTREVVSDPVIARLTSATQSMRVNAEKMADLASAIQGDHTFVGATARQNFSGNAMRLWRNADERISEAITFAFAEIGRVSDLIKPPVLSDKHMASEIRARLAQLKPEERAAALANDDVVSAAVNAPPFLSGMTPAEIDLHRIAWIEKKFPNEVDGLRRLGQALDDARRIAISGDGYFKDVVKVVVTPAVRSAARTKAAEAAIAAAAVE